MKIKKILFFSFFFIMMVTSLLTASVVMHSFKSTLEKEINEGLERDANFIMEEIDLMMFSRLQSVQFWAQLDVMQEGRIGDIDKQLSQFLISVKNGYQTYYKDLLLVHTNHNIIASSNVEQIGQNFLATQEHYKSISPKGEMMIQDERRMENPEPSPSILIRFPVIDNYSGESFGQLYGHLDLASLYRLLDKASHSDAVDRHIILLDAEGDMIAASTGLRLPHYSQIPTFANWRPLDKRAVFMHDGAPISPSAVVVGYALSKGYMGYSPMGWSVLVVQNVDQVYLSLHKLWLLFICILLVMLLYALWASQALSIRIATPILALSNWVQTYLNFEKPPKPFANVSKITEVHNLGLVFNNMLKDLEKTREQCIQASKLAVIGEMSAIMAHEIRTPLGILTTAVECLRKEQKLTGTSLEITEIIKTESARLNKLVTHLLDCASPKAPEMNAHNLHEILNHVYLLLKPKIEKKQLTLRWDLLPYHPVILGDKDLLTQVFLNIWMNAIQITPEKGIIQLTSSIVDGTASIEIADSGPGINAADFNRIFDPFFTKRENGIGLGLTVTYQIIQAHNGSISAKRSTLGGASLTVLLPLDNNKNLTVAHLGDDYFQAI